MLERQYSSPRPSGQPFDEVRTQAIIDQFNLQGYCHLGPVLSGDEVAALKNAMIRKWDDPTVRDDEAGDHLRGTSMMRMFEYDQSFRDLVVREPFASLAEAVLGDNCQLMSQNALRTAPGQGGGWHVDDLVHFPLPDSIERHDPRLVMPCFIMQIFTPLTDVDALEFGPTQVVPGSQYAGRRPHSQDEPHFDGRGPVSLFAKAGEAYMFNNQIWHQGAPNRSDRVRYMAGATYSKRFVAQRFYPFVDYTLPEYVLAGTDQRTQRFFGRHQKGAYG